MEKTAKEPELRFLGIGIVPPLVWILSAAVTDVGPKKVAVFLWQNSVSGPKKISCWDHWDRVTGIHTKPPIMPFFSEFRSVHSMFLASA